MNGVVLETVDRIESEKAADVGSQGGRLCQRNRKRRGDVNVIPVAASGIVIVLIADARAEHEIEGWYFDAGISKDIGVTDALEVVVSAGISYQIDYYAFGGDFNHVYVAASLPISLTDTATLEPYVAGLFALDAIDDIQDDIIHGGVSIGVSF